MTKPARAARDILAAHPDLSSLPINVRDIAKQFAYVQRDVLPDSVSGMLIPAPPGGAKPWIIAVNRRHSPNRQRFTLAHELGHAILHRYETAHADGVQRVYYRDGESSKGTNREEIEANQFAAELLMPATILVPMLANCGLDSWSGNESGDGASLERISDLAAIFRVSEEAMLLRIGSLLQRE